MDGKSTLERAFEIAKSGKCSSIMDLRRQLTAERYEAVDSHLGGSAIAGQLKKIMKTACSED